MLSATDDRALSEQVLKRNFDDFIVLSDSSPDSLRDRDRFAVARQQRTQRLFRRASYDPLTLQSRAIEVPLRWPHRERGVVMPVEVMPALSRMHILPVVSEELLGLGLTQYRTWRDGGLKNTRLAFNVDAGQLCAADFVDSVANRLRETRGRGAGSSV